MTIMKTAIAGALAVGTLAGAGPATAKTRLLFNIFVPPKHLMRTAIAAGWIKRVEAASKGQIKVHIPAKTLAPAPRQWGMITDGIADVTVMYNVFERRRLTLIQMSYLPFMVPTARSAGIALWHTQNKYYAKAHQFKGVKLLGFFFLPPGAIHSMDKPIKSVADLKEMKIRVSPGVPAKAAAALGGVPVPTPGIKAYEVVSKGVVDAMFFPPSDTYSLKMVPYVKHTLLVPGGLYGASFSLFMNQKKFDGLPKAQQAAIMASSGEKIAEDGAAMDKLNNVALKALKDHGATIDTANAAFMAEAKKKLAFLRTGWLAAAKKAGVDGKAALAYYTAEANKAAAQK
jgi:TRAP-type C4-dicarboxylate transport system substrate-binding protein